MRPWIVQISHGIATSQQRVYFFIYLFFGGDTAATTMQDLPSMAWSLAQVCVSGACIEEKNDYFSRFFFNSLQARVGCGDAVVGGLSERSGRALHGGPLQWAWRAGMAGMVG